MTVIMSEEAREQPPIRPPEALPRTTKFSDSVQQALTGHPEALEVLPEVVRDKVLSNVNAFKEGGSLEEKVFAAQILGDKEKIRAVLHAAGFNKEGDDVQIDSLVDSMMAPSQVPVDRDDPNKLGEYEVTSEPSDPTLNAEAQAEQRQVDEEALEAARDAREITNGLQNPATSEEDKAKLIEKADTFKHKMDLGFMKKIMKSSLKVGGVGIGIFVILSILILMLITGGKGRGR